MISAAIDLGTSTVDLSLWDTAGQERFAPLSAPYFRHADGVVLVFDLGARRTFERLGAYWAAEIEAKASAGADVVLVGAKADLPPDARAVHEAEARELADAHGWEYFEASAKSGAHVRDAFYLVACTVMNRLIEADPANAATSVAPPDKASSLLHTSGRGAKGAKRGCC